MKPKMITESFSVETYKKMQAYSHKAEYIRTLNTQIEMYTGFSMVWFYIDDEIVGYALIDDVLGGFFYASDDHEEIMEVVSENRTYTYLAYFEIFADKQRMGYGSEFLKLLQEKYKDYPMIVYTTEASIEFWLSKGYEEANYSDWWLIHIPTSVRQVAI